MKTTKQASASVMRFCVRLIFIALSFLFYRFLKLSESRFFNTVFFSSSKAGDYTSGAGIGPKNIRRAFSLPEFPSQNRTQWRGAGLVNVGPGGEGDRDEEDNDRAI
jgi:hypothetical protein